MYISEFNINIVVPNSPTNTLFLSSQNLYIKIKKRKEVSIEVVSNTLKNIEKKMSWQTKFSPNINHKYSNDYTNLTAYFHVIASAQALCCIINFPWQKHIFVVNIE